MVFTALAKLSKKSIHLIFLSINLMSGSAQAINEDHKSILKQLSLHEYEEIDRELKEKNLYVQAKFYIDKVMSGVNRRKRNNFFRSKNREMAKKMGVKANHNTTKFGIPYTLLRTFNLVQAMIHYGKVEPIKQTPIINPDRVTIDKSNRAVSVVEDYVDKLLSESAEQTPTTDMGLISLFFEDRNCAKKITRIITTKKNKDFNLQSIYSVNHPEYEIYMQRGPNCRSLHLLRNGEFILTHVNIIRKGNLQDGDKIIHTVPLKKFKPNPISPKRNSASRAREIYIAIDRLQNFLNKRYPKKFRFSINEENMFMVTLDFVAPYGWWKDAFFRIEYYFDNIGNEGPVIYVKYAPRVSYLYGHSLCLMQTYKNSQRVSEGPPKMYDSFDQWWWFHCSGRVRYGSENFSVEEQILNTINFLTADFDIRSEGILSRVRYLLSPQFIITHEILDVNRLAKKNNNSVYVETDYNKIEKSVNERIKDGEDPAFDYLIIDEELDIPEKPESFRTDIFIPVEMHNEAEIIESTYTSIRNFDNLVNEARKKSGFKIPKNVEPIVFYKNKKLDECNFQKVLYDLRKRNTKKKKKEEKKGKIKNNIITMIVRVPDYERPAFENAIASSVTYYAPENPCQLTYNEIHNESYEVKTTTNKGKHLNNDIGKPIKSKVVRPIKWEIHLAEKKKLAKANIMFYQYKLIFPLETQKTTERYRGGAQYGIFANIWIPTIRDDMSDVEKKFVLLSMYDLSRHKFKIPNHLKKASVSNLGNNIITKALLTPQNDGWSPSQVHLELLLQRVQLSLLISHEDYSIAKENNIFFECVISGNIDETVIKDLGFFIGPLVPSLRYVSKMNGPDKVEVIYRIVINYLIEVCVRTVTCIEFDASSVIARKLIDKPEQFNLEDIHTSNKQGIALAFNVLQIADFLFTKTIFTPFYKDAFDFIFYENELENLQIIFKSVRKIIDGGKNLIPLFLSHLFPSARHYLAGFDFESSEFLNKFILSVLKKSASRTTNKDIKVSLQSFITKTERKSDIFSKAKTEELISLFRKNTPEILINVPNGQGGFRQTCCHCGEVYETENPIRGKGRHTNRSTKKTKEPLIRPFHKACMIEDKRIREQAGQLYKKMAKRYPKTQTYEPYYSHHNPLPEGFELIRINGDGNCMYSSIAEIFNRHAASGQAGVWSQKTIRQVMDYNLHQIFSMIQIHPDKDILMEELELLLGIDADIIQEVLDNNVITDSTSFAHSESGTLQPFGSAQLIALLVPTQGVWFPVITQAHDGPYQEIYDLTYWVNTAPNLLAMLLQDENYTFPDLSESQRTTLFQLLLNQNLAQAKRFVSQNLIASYQSSAYLVHYPGSVTNMEHFDAAVSIDIPQNMEVDGAFEVLPNDENNRRMRSDPVSSASANETDYESLENNDSLLLMIQTSFELIRINGDGNCMYSSIAEIFKRNGRSGQAGDWNQQTIRHIIDYNLRLIFSTIQDHADKEKLMQELELLLGIDTDVIPAVLDNNVITDSASFAQSDLARLQQFGDSQLITLLVPTHGVWFPVITQGHHGSHHEIYDLKRWVVFAPNLLVMLLKNSYYTFPDLSESQRAILLNLLLKQNFDQASLFVSQTLADSHQSSAYLIHTPNSEALLEHFDAAVRIAPGRNIELDPPQIAQLDETFEDISLDENDKRMKLDSASSVSTNETARKTSQDSNPLSFMIQTRAEALLTKPANNM
ncbi:hypothetical protein [Endozoicomonas sp. 8E]|uniref:hypothetical protein n=1 Tax=Endozoicomonas sp. 8E TaxID=3035692 RepID=UPI002938D96D|nr:hypothetical protein [Endozoicomonas sp. 8E]WOG29462.1 hypothetical protein P6910_07380 [Endozoicomonas sp. 8E]